MICIRNLFEPISFINRTNSRQIWTPKCACKDIDHNAKSPSFGPKKTFPRFSSTSPNRSGVGAVDNPDQIEQVCDQFDISTYH